MNTVQIDRPSPAGPSGGPARRSLAARWGAFVARRRRLVAVVWLFAVVVAGVLGVRVFGALQAGGFDDSGSESAHAASVLSERFDARDPAAVLAVRA